MTADPFALLAPLTSGLKRAPLPPLFLVTGDDDWIVAEAVRRLVETFRSSFREGEVSSYGTAGGGVKEAVADAATVALFSTNRLVVLEATDLLRAGKVTAEEVDALLDEAGEAGLGGSGADARVLQRLARRAMSMARTAGLGGDEDPSETARRLAGRVKRTARAAELAELLALAPVEEEDGEGALERLLDYVSRASAGDNTLLLHAVSPDREHHAVSVLRRAAVAGDFSAPEESLRRRRLAAIGLERALERHMAVDPEVYDLLTERGRMEARGFVSELDRLMDSAPAGRVTVEAAARLVLDERKEYGSDFVDAAASRRSIDALRILERLLAGGEFTAFRPYGAREEPSGGRKAPKGDAAFFPILGLLAGEVRRMLALKAAVGGGARRVDYRTFTERVLGPLRAPRKGAPPLVLDAHPFALHKAYINAMEWGLEELVDALLELEAIDRRVKTGLGSGPELLEAFLLTRSQARTA